MDEQLMREVEEEFAADLDAYAAEYADVLREHFRELDDVEDDEDEGEWAAYHAREDDALHYTTDANGAEHSPEDGQFVSQGGGTKADRAARRTERRRQWEAERPKRVEAERVRRRERNTQRVNKRAAQARSATKDDPYYSEAGSLLAAAAEKAVGATGLAETRAAAKEALKPLRVATRSVKAKLKVTLKDAASEAAAAVASKGDPKRARALARELTRVLDGTADDLAVNITSDTDTAMEQAAMAETRAEALKHLSEGLNGLRSPDRLKGVVADIVDPEQLERDAAEAFNEAGWPVDLAPLADDGKTPAEMAAVVKRHTGIDFPAKEGEDAWGYYDRSGEAFAPLHKEAAQALVRAVMGRLGGGSAASPAPPPAAAPPQTPLQSPDTQH